MCRQRVSANAALTPIETMSAMSVSISVEYYFPPSARPVIVHDFTLAVSVSDELPDALALGVVHVWLAVIEIDFPVVGYQSGFTRDWIMFDWHGEKLKAYCRCLVCSDERLVIIGEGLQHRERVETRAGWTVVDWHAEIHDCGLDACDACFALRLVLRLFIGDHFVAARFANGDVIDALFRFHADFGEWFCGSAFGACDVGHVVGVKELCGVARPWTSWNS